MKTIARAITEDQIQNRKDEIIKSCYEVYYEKGFIKTSIKDISEKLSFARTSIYNYYQTKEEIFLDLLKLEYNYLYDDLHKILELESIDIPSVSHMISEAISKRLVLLQIISTSLNELEKNSRIEFLIDFKKSYKNVIDETRNIIEKFSDLTKEEVDIFIELFFPFLFGLCSFTIVSSRQEEAMKKAGIVWVKKTTEELCYDFIIYLLKGGNKNGK